jgi:hypothetical protein
MRMLLKLYPRRIRDRYGDELLDLQNELRAQGEVSRTRLIRDMLAGALLIRPARQRARLVIGTVLLTGAVLVIVGLAMAGTIIGGRGTDSPAPASHFKVRLEAQSLYKAIPFDSCFLASGSSCSLAPCTEFTGRSSAEDAVAYSSVPATRRRPRLTGTRCVSYPHVQPQRPVFVSG